MPRCCCRTPQLASCCCRPCWQVRRRIKMGPTTRVQKTTDWSVTRGDPGFFFEVSAVGDVARLSGQRLLPRWSTLAGRSRRRRVSERAFASSAVSRARSGAWVCPPVAGASGRAASVCQKRRAEGWRELAGTAEGCDRPTRGGAGGWRGQGWGSARGQCTIAGCAERSSEVSGAPGFS